MPVAQHGRELIAERAGAVAILTIDRPSRRNAIGVQLVEQLFEELDHNGRDPGTRAIVLTGTAPGFCAGSDLRSKERRVGKECLE